MWRGMVVEALREGEEGGVELVVLVGLAESSCGDVGKVSRFGRNHDFTMTFREATTA